MDMARCKQEIDINAPVNVVWQLTQNMNKTRKAYRSILPSAILEMDDE
jgi:hypothetical protein